MLHNKTIDLTSPTRQIQARVELYKGNTLAQSFTHKTAIKSVAVERVGEQRFFGYGICQKLKLNLIDRDRAITITKGDKFKLYFNDINNFPIFIAEEITRDENTNEISVIAYDALYDAKNYTVSEIALTDYSIFTFAEECGYMLGVLTWLEIPEDDTTFGLTYDGTANFDGTETIRDALNAVADATQTIYYMNYNNDLVFKRLDRDGMPVLDIDKVSYFTLSSKGSRTLTTIVSTTELGDNMYSTTGEEGDTHQIKDNPFWELREDLPQLLETAIDAVGGFTLDEFDLKWRGNYLLEIGDKLQIVGKDDRYIVSYLLDDVIEYTGGMAQTTKFELADSDKAHSNSSTLGSTLKQTFAKVDKVNKQIDIVASDVDTNSEDISTLQLTTSSISASVSNMSNDVGALAKKVEATISSEELEIAVKKEVENGVEKVTTTTGFTFNEEGLTVSKSGSEMTTQITEDGMTVYRESGAVLTADNTGVNAENLTATTYLIIGNNSRFEDYDNGRRTGCFWIGG